MFRVLILLVMALALAVPSICSAQYADTHAFAADAYGVEYTEQRITNLPQDQGKFYTSVIGDPNDPKFQKMVSWFDSVPALKDVKAQTHFAAYPTTGTMYKTRYAKTVSALPCLRVQDSQGRVAYQVSGQNVPMTGEAVANVLSTECFRRWCKPNPQPQPQPDPDYEPYVEPNPDVQPEPTPDVSPTPDVEPVPASSMFPWAWLLGSIAVGAVAGTGVGVVKKYRETYPSK